MNCKFAIYLALLFLVGEWISHGLAASNAPTHYIYGDDAYGEWTFFPTLASTARPSYSPTLSPSLSPLSPTPIYAPYVLYPTRKPTRKPIVAPTLDTSAPTLHPSGQPSLVHTTSPTILPTYHPTTTPTASPSLLPTVIPSALPTVAPSGSPTTSPTPKPSTAPSTHPSFLPSVIPSALPTVIPSGYSTPSPSVSSSASFDSPHTAVPSSLRGFPPSSAVASPSLQPSSLPTKAKASDYVGGDRNKLDTAVSMGGLITGMTRYWVLGAIGFVLSVFCGVLFCYCRRHKCVVEKWFHHESVIMLKQDMLTSRDSSSSDDVVSEIDLECGNEEDTSRVNYANDDVTIEMVSVDHSQHVKAVKAAKQEAMRLLLTHQSMVAGISDDVLKSNVIYSSDIGESGHRLYDLAHCEDVLAEEELDSLHRMTATLAYRISKLNMKARVSLVGAAPQHHRPRKSKRSLCTLDLPSQPSSASMSAKDSSAHVTRKGILKRQLSKDDSEIGMSSTHKSVQFDMKDPRDLL